MSSLAQAVVLDTEEAVLAVEKPVAKEKEEEMEALKLLVELAVKVKTDPSLLVETET